MSKEVRYDAIYARQSVDKKESVSIEAQIADCKTLCSQTVRVYSDKGYSGKNTERPNVQRLIKDIEAGIIEKVVVYKLDRISRNITDFYKLYEVMKSNNCEFISWTEKFDTTTSMGRAMMGILAVFAQMERENIQTRIKDNYAYRIRDGRWASGKAPFGFRNGKVDGKTSLIPIPEEIETVKWMFKTYAESPSISLGKIQSMLIERGITGHQSDRGFSRTTIGHILTNPVYCAADELLYQYYQKKLIEFANPAEKWNGKYSAAIVGKNTRSLRNEDLSGIIVYITNVIGVIDSRTFLMVQNRMEENSAIAADNKPNNNLKELSGLLKCAECGSAVKMQAQPTLTCTGRGQKKICNVSFRGIKLEAVQQKVGELIQGYLQDMNQTRERKLRQQKKIKDKIAHLKKQRDNLIEMAMVSDIVADEVKYRVNDLIIQIKELQIKLKTDNAQDIIELRLGIAKNSPLKSIYDENGMLIFNYIDLNTEQRQVILRVLVNKILLHPDGNISIEWKD